MSRPHGKVRRTDVKLDTVDIRGSDIEDGRLAAV